MLECRLFSRGEMVDMLMEASLRGEGFMTLDDAVEAAELEMQHAFGQGIISKELSLKNAHLTLKALFLYTRSPGSERWVKDRKFWECVVDIAVRSDAGLCLLDVFTDEGDANNAYEWMKSIHVDKTLPMANRIFVTPMFANEDEINDEGAVDAVVAPEGGGGEGADGVGSLQGVDAVERGDNDGGGVRSLVGMVKCLTSRASVVEAIVEFFRPNRGRNRSVRTDGEKTPTPPPTAFKPDLDLVWEAGLIIGDRQKGNEYRKKVKDLQVGEPPKRKESSGDDGDDSDSDDSDGPSGEGERDGGGLIPGERQGGGGASTPGEPDVSLFVFVFFCRG